MHRELAVVAGLGLFLAPGPAWAHHAFQAEFDANRPVRLRGTVTKMEWINPHAWIHVSVRKPDGSEEAWIVEAATPNTLFRRGLTRNSLPAGLEIVVDGYHAKDGSLKLSGQDLTFRDGQKVFLGASGTSTPKRESSAHKTLGRPSAR